MSILNDMDGYLNEGVDGESSEELQGLAQFMEMDEVDALAQYVEEASSTLGHSIAEWVGEEYGTNATGLSVNEFGYALTSWFQDKLQVPSTAKELSEIIGSYK